MAKKKTAASMPTPKAGGTVKASVPKVTDTLTELPELDLQALESYSRSRLHLKLDPMESITVKRLKVKYAGKVLSCGRKVRTEEQAIRFLLQQLNG